jgi:hypothetical protein
VSRAFDSGEATQRLAALTGAQVADAARLAEEKQSATQLLRTTPPQRRTWRRRDWLVVGGAALLGLAVARKVIRRTNG